MLSIRKRQFYHRSEIVTTNSRCVVVWPNPPVCVWIRLMLKKSLVLMFVVSHVFEKRWVTGPGSLTSKAANRHSALPTRTLSATHHL